MVDKDHFLSLLSKGSSDYCLHGDMAICFLAFGAYDLAERNKEFVGAVINVFDEQIYRVCAELYNISDAKKYINAVRFVA